MRVVECGCEDHRDDGAVPKRFSPAGQHGEAAFALPVREPIHGGVGDGEGSAVGGPPGRSRDAVTCAVVAGVGARGQEFNAGVEVAAPSRAVSSALRNQIRIVSAW
ncbi:hypothetical protein [Paractinoplanes atraurantiacus]|uniref:hypothetical protein n=1 Tax=Paractinoplanes atraurantiacus TaxID=1036182 RepID=UPI0011780913|nr:hypothetical protein [Actinoplanes atraurantiacus]